MPGELALRTVYIICGGPFYGDPELCGLDPTPFESLKAAAQQWRYRLANQDKFPGWGEGIPDDGPIIAEAIVVYEDGGYGDLMECVRSYSQADLKGITARF